MKIYIILREDHGYLGYGRDIGGGATIESVHKSFDDAYWHIQGNYKNVTETSMLDPIPEEIVGMYRWFADGEDDHVYEFTIYEKELV